jgi:hypothetical protein
MENTNAKIDELKSIFVEIDRKISPKNKIRTLQNKSPFAKKTIYGNKVVTDMNLQTSFENSNSLRSLHAIKMSPRVILSPPGEEEHQMNS